MMLFYLNVSDGVACLAGKSVCLVLIDVLQEQSIF